MASGHSRRFSERDDPDGGDSSCLGVFSHSRTSLPSHHPDNVIHKVKRRKTYGLNNRFDRMIESMGVMSSSPTNSGRSRARSTGSSSVSSHGLPRTPANSYSGLDDGRLGKDFSLIKMEVQSGSLGAHTSRRADPADPNSSPGRHIPQDQRGSAPLPAWLRDTFSSLAPKHPLRVLLPPPPPPSDMALNQPEGLSVDPLAEAPMGSIEEAARTFAFSPEQVPVVPSHERKISATDSHSLLSPLVLGNRVQLDTEISKISENTPLNFQLPFSTPGPGSLVGFSHLDTAQSPSMCATLSPVPRSTHLTLQDAPEPFPYTDLADLALSSRSQKTDSSNNSSDPALYCDDAPTDESASDPISESSYVGRSLPDFFSTPGPGYRVSQPIYFNSPAEDPSSSDPPEFGCKIDYDQLGFSWKPFHRKGNGEAKLSPEIAAPHKICSSLDLAIAEPPSLLTADCRDYFDEGIEIDPELLPGNADPGTAHRLSGTPESPNPFRFAPPPDEQSANNAEPGSTPPQINTLIFAPTSGILISPLKNPPSPEKPPHEHPQERLAAPARQSGTGENPSLFLPQSSVLQALDYATANPSSQTSHDSIESWDNAKLNDFF
ncbi:hypothetical protein BD779DRAFT_1669680 [Infundibulicybe gibba]|nr:hypothetical protein BD779DRAFT_1669680 [Infundibulicybe gibba]